MWLDLRSLWESSGGGSASLSIDTPGSITLAGQSITADDGVDLSAQGAITYAGQSTTFGIGVAPTNGALTYAGQSVTFNDGVALSTQGSITFAGQATGLAIGTALSIDTVGAITFAGQSVTANTGVALSIQGAITFNGQTVALDVSGDVALSIDTAGRITYAGQDVSLVAPAQSVAGRRRRPTLYFVTVDGEQFEFRTYEAAVAFLRKTKEAAEELADREIEEAVARQSETTIELDAPKFTLPEIRVSSRELRPVVTETKRDIAATYERAARNAETAILLALVRKKQQEEDEEIFWLF